MENLNEYEFLNEAFEDVKVTAFRNGYQQGLEEGASVGRKQVVLGMVLLTIGGIVLKHKAKKNKRGNKK